MFFFIFLVINVFIDHGLVVIHDIYFAYELDKPNATFIFYSSTFI